MRKGCFTAMVDAALFHLESARQIARLGASQPSSLETHRELRNVSEARVLAWTLSRSSSGRTLPVYRGDEACDLCVSSNSYKKKNYRAQYIVQGSERHWWKIGILVFEEPFFAHDP